MKKLTITFMILGTILVGCKIENKAKATAADSTTTEEPKIPDPLLGYMWFLKNTGQAAFSNAGGTPGADINYDNLYELGITGKGVKVAVSDTNIDIDHEDVAKNASLATSRNYIKDPPWQGFAPIVVNTYEAHGTTVFGLLGAVAMNGKGARGVAPEATMSGFNYVSSSQSLTRKLDQAKGSFDIFNYSYGTALCSVVSADSTYAAQLKEGVTLQRSGKGSVYVKSSGNEYTAPKTDCNASATGYYLGNANMDQITTYPYYILAAALTASGPLADYSTPGSNIWISAPGGQDGVSGPGIITTDLGGCNKGYSYSSVVGANNFDKGLDPLNKSCMYVSGLEGTSYSAPIVSGVVALMLQANPNLTWRDVKYILAKTATKIDSTSVNLTHPMGYNLSGWTYDRGWVRNSANFWFHNWYGFGRVNAKAAVTMAQSYVSSLGTLVETADPSTGEWYFQSGPVGATITDNSSVPTTSDIAVSSDLIIEGAQISVNITHSYPSELGIEIVSPAGTRVTILNVNSGIINNGLINTKFLANAFYGESSYGNWTIRVVDGNANDTGTLNSWKINFFGHYP